MALLHQARLTPSKLEAIQAWLPGRLYDDRSDPAALRLVGAYRFDDPDGEVGIETHLALTASGLVLQVPLTYRAAPLPGAEDALVGVLEHSVLGRRWTYDGCADPVAVQAYVTAMLTGGEQAEVEVQTASGRTVREPTTWVWGSGSAGTPVPELEPGSAVDGPRSTVVSAGPVRLVLARVLDPAAAADGHTLRGRWTGGPDDVLLASLTGQPR